MKDRFWSVRHGCLLSWDLNDLTSGALLCHYRLSRQSCYMCLLLPFLPHSETEISIRSGRVVGVHSSGSAWIDGLLLCSLSLSLSLSSQVPTFIIRPSIHPPLSQGASPSLSLSLAHFEGTFAITPARSAFIPSSLSLPSPSSSSPGHSAKFSL